MSASHDTLDKRLSLIEVKVKCRKIQAETILNLLGEENEMMCENIFLHGDTSTGKTFLASFILKELGYKHVWIDGMEVYAARVLFEGIINQLNSIDDKVDQSFSHSLCDNMCDFSRNLKRIVDDKLERNRPLAIVIDNAEKLRDLDSTVLFALLRLQAITKRNIGLILISQIPWEHFQFVYPGGLPEPVVVKFPQYTKEELLDIMSLSCPEHCPTEIYNLYLQYVMSVFCMATSNLRELRYVANLNFKKFYEAVDSTGSVSSQKDAHRLWRNIEPYLKKSLNSVYLREVSSEQWQKMLEAENETQITQRKHMDLPFYSKFLLIASYLASYNPPVTDRKYFVKNQGKTKKKRINDVKKEKPSRHLLGPKPFPLERMLAIFKFIVGHNVPISGVLLSQVSSLVYHHLLSKVTSDMELHSPKYICQLNLDTIRDVAKTVDFDIIGHLDEFNS